MVSCVASVWRQRKARGTTAPTGSAVMRVLTRQSQDAEGRTFPPQESRWWLGDRRLRGVGGHAGGSRKRPAPRPRRQCLAQARTTGSAGPVHDRSPMHPPRMAPPRHGSPAGPFTRAIPAVAATTPALPTRAPAQPLGFATSSSIATSKSGPAQRGCGAPQSRQLRPTGEAGETQNKGVRAWASPANIPQGLPKPAIRKPEREQRRQRHREGRHRAG